MLFCSLSLSLSLSHRRVLRYLVSLFPSFWRPRSSPVLVFRMGFLSWFYVEAKAFKLSVEEGCFALRIIERSGGVSRAMFMGKVSVEWLFATVETLV